MVNRVDLKGNIYGKLTVLEEAGRNKHGSIRWRCLCECGNTSTVDSGNLRSGRTTSCGCLVTENIVALNTTHGMTGTFEHTKWLQMRHRCKYPESSSFRNYGAKGIYVCEEWENDFLAFYNHIGPAPSGAGVWSIDRIDNSKGYEPGNVRWVPLEQQARNKGLQKNNKTGITGVYKNSAGTAYIAQWITLDGIKKNKTFSIRVHGEDQAFALAIEARKNAIEELNKQGANYSENHGL